MHGSLAALVRDSQTRQLDLRIWRFSDLLERFYTVSGTEVCALGFSRDQYCTIGILGVAG